MLTKLYLNRKSDNAYISLWAAVYLFLAFPLRLNKKSNIDGKLEIPDDLHDGKHSEVYRIITINVEAFKHDLFEPV